MSPDTAIAFGKAGGLGVLDLEGLWTRYDDPLPLLEGSRQLRGPQRPAGCRRSTRNRSSPT